MSCRSLRGWIPPICAHDQPRYVQQGDQLLSLIRPQASRSSSQCEPGPCASIAASTIFCSASRFSGVSGCHNPPQGRLGALSAAMCSSPATQRSRISLITFSGIEKKTKAFILRQFCLQAPTQAGIRQSETRPSAVGWSVAWLPSYTTLLRSSSAFNRWRALRCFVHGAIASAHQVAQRLVQGVRHAHGTDFPARARCASINASRRSALTRSPERLGMDEGATTSQWQSSAARWRCSTKPQGHARRPHTPGGLADQAAQGALLAASTPSGHRPQMAYLAVTI